MKLWLYFSLILVLAASTLGLEEQDDYGFPVSTTKRCPATRTQNVQGTTTSTYTVTISIVDASTVYNGTTTLTSGTSTVYSATTIYTATYTNPGKTFSVYSTVYNSSTTTKTVCLKKNKPPKRFPTPCSRTIERTITAPTAYATTGVVKLLGDYTVTGNMTIYPYTTTSYDFRSDSLIYYSIVTEYHNTTCYAATATTTLPVFPTPTNFKLQATGMPPSGQNRNGRYAEEEIWYVELLYLPGLSLEGNLTTGSIFNLTRLSNTTTLGRPGFNSTCGAWVYDQAGSTLNFFHYASYIACPTDSIGWGSDRDDANLLHTCYIDCSGMLRCAVGEATEWEYESTGYDDPIFPISLVQPKNEEDDVWIQNPGRFGFKVVPWAGD